MLTVNVPLSVTLPLIEFVSFNVISPLLAIVPSVVVPVVVTVDVAVEFVNLSTVVVCLSVISPEFSALVI